jgi:hypothetical protein
MPNYVRPGQEPAPRNQPFWASVEALLPLGAGGKWIDPREIDQCGALDTISGQLWRDMGSVEEQQAGEYFRTALRAALALLERGQMTS